MARTPLLQQLAALARVADRSHSTGVSTDELLDGAPIHTRAIDRRAFLSAAGLAIGAAACADEPRTALAPTGPRLARGGASAPRVAIVGAGLAGLTCALRLRQAGVAATVYEGSARLGGRCWTRRDGTFADGQQAEHGGELIDQSHTSIRQLAQELGLALDNVLAAEARGTDARFWFDGAAYTPDQAAHDLKAVWQPLKRDYVEASYPTLYTESTPRGRALDAMSVAQWIEATVPGGRTSKLGQLLETAYIIEYGAEASEQSALNLIYLLGAIGQGKPRLFGPSNEKYKVRGGNDQLVQRMAAMLGGQIETGAALRSIAAAGGGWSLGFDGRASVTADRVVLALPFSILRTGVDWKLANFPAVKARAIKELGMGQNAKLALQFRTRHWTTLGCNGDTTSDRGYQQTWEATRAQAGRAGILVDYTGGQATLAQSGRLPSALAEEFLTRIEPVLPGLTAEWNGRAAFEDWPRNPWTLGSYSYYAPGQYTAFGGAEAEAVGSCHFAGEHTSTDAQGYLEGAVESGERAAREVLAGLGVIPRA
jgi:monoamine oxidase